MLALEREFMEMESKIQALDTEILKLRAKVNPQEREIERLKNQLQQSRSQPRLDDIGEKILVALANSAAFAFTSDLSHTQLSQSLRPLLSENLRFLLVELSAVVSTSTSQKSGDWLYRRLTLGQK